jgi:thiol-disulfide isomerase/thioredoxin
VAIVGLIVFLVLVKIVTAPTPPAKASTSSSGASPAPASLVKTVTSVPASIFNTIGQGTITVLPKTLPGPTLSSDGKPQIVDISAEYCPFCAAERWPLVIALSRFGTFSNLNVTHSGAADVYPNTQTFSFYQSSYSSQYLTFNGTEIQSNQAQGSSYAPLETPSNQEQALMSKYDAPPYVPQDSADSIPFIDFANQFLISGASYSPSILQGKSDDQIGSALSDTSSAISQGIIGTANIITATLCETTKNQPANVCSSPMITQIEGKLTSQ